MRGQVDLVGGYYDSGDHVKFGFPMAYAVTMLSWGVLELDKEMVAANNLQRALDAIRWGTNYFIKAHTEPNGLWVQVGDGDSDHLCWERAEDMSTPRTAFKIDINHPGSDVAGETAAALAAAAKAFRPYDSMYADLLLLHAKQVHLRYICMCVLCRSSSECSTETLCSCLRVTALHIRRHVQRQIR